MVNIVIPMAGLGSRFAKEGYNLPKPLIDVAGKPMIEVVVNNLRPQQPHKFIFICQNAHIESYKLDSVLRTISPTCEIVGIDGLTEGAACTVLKAEHLINNQNTLVIANCDQYVDADMDDFLNAASRFDGYIMTMKAHDKKWSFVRLDQSKLVQEVKEKEVISDEATVGIYHFKNGADFCNMAHAMIQNNDRVNHEFYVAPVYNYLIKNGSRIGIYNIGTLGNGMYGIGVPEDLKDFLQKGIV